MAKYFLGLGNLIATCTHEKNVVHITNHRARTITTGWGGGGGEEGGGRRGGRGKAEGCERTIHRVLEAASLKKKCEKRKVSEFLEVDCTGSNVYGSRFPPTSYAMFRKQASEGGKTKKKIRKQHCILYCTQTERPDLAKMRNMMRLMKPFCAFLMTFFFAMRKPCLF